MRKVLIYFAFVMLFACNVFVTNAQTNPEPGKMILNVDKPGVEISPLLYGLMTEEINFSYEGGLYGELIQNRDFKSSWKGAVYPPSDNSPSVAKVPEGEIPCWSIVKSEGSQGDISFDTTDPLNSKVLNRSLKLNVTAVGTGGRVGIANEGYWGIPVRANTTYQASFYAKASNGFTGSLTASLESKDGKTVFASGTVAAVSEKWQKYNITLKTSQLQPVKDAYFVISCASKGTVNFNFVSLFPPTYKDRPNGNRVDLMKLLADMKPAFLRFPGGNYLEGGDLANRWAWKDTIGPLEERPGHLSPWRYRSTDGMGLLEFMLWCEELDMEPVLGIFAGFVLRGYDADFTGQALQPYIDEALEQIEYLTGDIDSKWGAQRAKDGHPEPFKLKYVEIGNEDPQGTYAQRFPAFYKAIKAKYPDIQIISSITSGYGDVIPDLIDEHYYMNFNSALSNAHMYDSDRRPRTNGDGKPAPKVIVGEWATRDNNHTPAFHAALTDAAYLTGLERNSDLVVMSCYAPIFVNVSDIGGPTRSQQWATNLIGYDALNSYGSPSYYAQKMFYNAKGDQVIPIESINPQRIPEPAQGQGANARRGSGFGVGGMMGGRGGGSANPNEPLFACASKEKISGDIILKVVNAYDLDQTMIVEMTGVNILKNAAGQVMTAGLEDTNTIEEPLKVVPKDFVINNADSAWEHTFPGHSITVIRFKTQ